MTDKAGETRRKRHKEGGVRNVRREKRHYGFRHCAPRPKGGWRTGGRASRPDGAASIVIVSNGRKASTQTRPSRHQPHERGRARCGQDQHPTGDGCRVRLDQSSGAAFGVINGKLVLAPGDDLAEQASGETHRADRAPAGPASAGPAISSAAAATSRRSRSPIGAARPSCAAALPREGGAQPPPRLR